MYYFAQVCRTCIQNDGNLIKIHDLDVDNITFYRKLTLCFPNLIFDDTSMKTYLCQNCSNILRKMYDFRELCINSERILNSYVSQLEQSNSLKNSVKNDLKEIMDSNYKDLIRIINELPKSSDIKLEKFDSEIDEEVKKTEIMNFEYVNVGAPESNTLLNIKNEPLDIKPDCQDCIIETERTNAENNTNANKDANIPSETSQKPEIKIKRTENNEKRFNCDICSKGYKFSGDLRVHKRIHSGEKSFKCDVCFKSFHRLDILNIHKRIHTGEKPYECDLCKKSFNRSGTLIKHKRIHTGEKPYKCDVCDKSFNDSGSLHKHKRIHTGEKPYECDVCNKSFNQSGHLYLHKRVHVNEKKNSENK